LKTILCFGDSNTWGRSPDGGRYTVDVRWPGVMRQRLGDGYWIVEEGLNGRTTVFDDPIEEGRCGKTFLPVCLMTHAPLDLVIIMLGTNDLKRRFNHSAYTISRGAGRLVEIVQSDHEAGVDGKPPQVLLICPAPVFEVPVAEEMFAGAEEKSKRLAAFYRQRAEELGCHFLNAGEVVASSRTDGIHLEAEQHRLLGEAIAEHLNEILG